MRRPGIWRSRPSLTAKNAECGPPKPSGTPNRCEEPRTMSAPSEPGETTRLSARRSLATTTTPPTALTAVMSAEMSRTRPDEPGFWMSAPNAPSAAAVAAPPPAKSTNLRVTPIGSARVSRTARVCGNASASTRKMFDSLPETRRAMSIASAAAEASSNIPALAVPMPVRSHTIVWKVIRASRRPCEISGW